MSALLSKEDLAQYIKIVNFDYSAVIENRLLVEPNEKAINIGVSAKSLDSL